MAAPAPARANAIRFTRTDVCGVPVAEATANSRLTTAGFVEVGMAMDSFSSADIQIVSAAGSPCVYSKGQNTLRGIDVSLSICTFNESILEMLLGSAILVDGADNVGGVVTADGTVNSNTLMVEWWSINGVGDSCTGANPRPYIHSVLPRVSRWSLTGNTDFGDVATTLQFTAYAEPTTAFAASRAADEFTAADIAAINQSGVYAYREVAALPAQIAGNSFDT